MSEKELDTLITAHLTGTISDEESKKLDQWLSDHENRKLLEKLEMVWAEDSQEPILSRTDSSARKSWSKVVGNKKANSWKWIAAAASISVLFILSIFLVDNNSQNAPNEIAVWANHQNPSGQKSKIHLSDGTVVWLNALSSLSYQKGFTDSTRIVVLEGEAFFDVAKDHHRVFEVVAKGLSVTALGTSFNVNAYPEGKSTRIALVTGKVGVRKMEGPDDGITLLPGEDAHFSLEDDTFYTGKFNKEEIVGWKDGLLIFNGSTYLEVINRLEQWYGVAIETEGSYPGDWALSARYDNQPLENVLINLKFQKQFDYEFIEGEKVILSFKEAK